MTQQTIESMAIESGLANFIEPSNPAVLRFVQALGNEFEARILPMIEEGVRRGAIAGAEIERKACAEMVRKYAKETENMEARGCLASVAYDIEARGQQ
jgi:hypothetical protein